MLSSKMSRIGRVDAEILAKVVKNGVPERFFVKISRNMTDTEKMMITNIIGNFVADNIVFDVSKIGPVDPEIWLKKSGQNSRNANTLSNMKDREFDPKAQL